MNRPRPRPRTRAHEPLVYYFARGRKPRAPETRDVPIVDTMLDEADELTTGARRERDVRHPPR